MEPVDNVSLITDRETGRLRGFGFVEMSNGADEAIAALNQTEVGGRRLVVNLAKPREERRPAALVALGPSSALELRLSAPPLKASVLTLTFGQVVC